MKVEKMKSISPEKIEVSIIGAGRMGTGIAQVFSQKGMNVCLVDISDEALERAREKIEEGFESLRKKGILESFQASEAKQRVFTTSSYEEACLGKNLKLVIESAEEDEETKKMIFSELQRLCPEGVILCSTTSSLDVESFTREINRSEGIIWMHFFFPANESRAVEYAGSSQVSLEDLERGEDYLKLAGKEPVRLQKFRRGGSTWIICSALMLEATRMLDDGFDVLSIEEAGKEAFELPFGFLRLMEKSGIFHSVVTMNSFSGSSNPSDQIFKTYENFFTPSQSCRRKLVEYEKSQDESKLFWLSEEVEGRKSEDFMLVEILKQRFLAVSFMTACEVVNAGVARMRDVDRLCQLALSFKEGPFSLMNRMGIRKAMEIVTERMELSHRREINFPIPEILIAQVQKNEPWPI